MRVLSLFVLAWSTSFSVSALAQATSSGATSSSQSKKKDSVSTEVAVGPATNACGCYEDSEGMCHCVKKSRCGCPGSCEPSGCEDKRRKEQDKELQQEARRQQDEDKKRTAELEKKREELDRKDAEKRERGLRGLRLVEPAK